MELLREQVLYESSACGRQCAPVGVQQPPLPRRHSSFYALGAFIYTLPSIGALADDDVFVPAIGYRKAFEFCRMVIHRPTATVT